MTLHRKEQATPRVAAILQTPMTLRNSTHDLGDWLKSFLSMDRTALSASRSSVADIKAPTVLIWGDVTRQGSESDFAYFASIAGF